MHTSAKSLKDLLPSAGGGGGWRHRWLIRAIAFLAILSYGVFILSSPRQLTRLLDAAFDVAVAAPSSDGGSLASHTNRWGFLRTPYHDHIRTLTRAGDEVGVIARNGNGTSSSSSSSPHVRISFELHDPKTVPLKNEFNLYVHCPLGKVTEGKRKKPTGEFRSGRLPPSLVRVDDDNDGGSGRGVGRNGRVLDFTVTVSTDLKLLLIGDSVMVQLAQAFDEMVMEREGGREGEVDIGRSHGASGRTVVWEAWRGHNGGTIVAPSRGGGASALWRMTALLSRSRKGRPPANSAGGGWSDKEINALLGHSYQPMRQPHNMTVRSFDVCVIRVMHGWMKLHEITHDRLVEAVELSHELLGARTVVLMTIPFTNNVKTAKELRRVEEINDDIREIARGWQSSRREEGTGNGRGVRHVLVLEYGTYYNHIIWSSAIHLGYANVTHPLRATRETFDAEGHDFLFDRLQEGGAWPPSVPMVCDDTKSLGKDRKTCNRNYLFLDGMHICPESLAGRYAAGLACLVGCVHNGRKDDEDSMEEEIVFGTRACERECNEQFLSVMPVEETLINANTTLASFSG